ncbi:hypothetical protein [Streptomyces lydicamycinicus]|uniref:hypothetical protein n=1 Tax=Streptomyces lydicamycinicus TaxID=1546107 RepID=UPI003C2DB474
MDIDPDEIVTVELDTYDWERSYSRLLTLRQLGELLLHFDDMADETEAAYERNRTQPVASSLGHGGAVEE